MSLSASVIDDPVQKLKWNIFWKKNWTWVSNQSQIERAHCVRVRPRSFARRLFQTDLIQATFKSVSITSGFCPYPFFSLYWILHIDVAFSIFMLMSQFCIFYLDGIFDIEVAYYKFIFDIDITFSTLMSQCCVFYFDATFSISMTLSSSMLHFLLWFHSFAFFALIRRSSTFRSFSIVNLNHMIRLKCS